MKKILGTEFVYQIFSLVIAVIIVHAIYVAVIRPKADSIVKQQIEQVQNDKNYLPIRSVFVTLRDYEQEICFILMLWAFAIMGYKGIAIIRERGLLFEELIPVTEGIQIFPEDTRAFSRTIQALPNKYQEYLLPRALLTGLHRFASTRNIQDVSTTVINVCDSESERLESELSMIRYIAWAIPSIGFIGTVRGIGEALGQAYKAVEGDITGVTQSLGVAFNSTLIALLISIVLMFIVHQLQLVQERLVLDTETYCDRYLIRRLQVRPLD